MLKERTVLAMQIVLGVALGLFAAAIGLGFVAYVISLGLTR
jgi:hypothetical protein